MKLSKFLDLPKILLENAICQCQFGVKRTSLELKSSWLLIFSLLKKRESQSACELVLFPRAQVKIVVNWRNISKNTFFLQKVYDRSWRYLIGFNSWLLILWRLCRRNAGWKFRGITSLLSIIMENFCCSPYLAVNYEEHRRFFFGDSRAVIQQQQQRIIACPGEQGSWQTKAS